MDAGAEFVVSPILRRELIEIAHESERPVMLGAYTPTEAQLADMLFAWKVAKHVKSNAIVYAGPDRTLGIGAGQMSRVDSSRIAVWKAKEAGLSLQNSVVASDAFFPFRDGLDVVVDAGATCVIQPGGSMRDQEVIDAADVASHEEPRRDRQREVAQDDRPVSGRSGRWRPDHPGRA